MSPPLRPPAAAAIFDLDGTLVDNMRFHVQAWSSFSQALGIDTPAERFEREFAGKRNEEILPALLGRSLPPEELTRLAEQKESHYRELFKPHLAPLGGARALLTRLKAGGRGLAVASAAPRVNRDFVLDGTGLRSFFSQVVGAEHVTRGKPFPDLFLAAAQALGAEPSACVVFEDAVNGVLAARAAGMFAVGVTTLASAEMLREAGAHWVIDDFTALPEELAQWLVPSL
ncbi:HAD family hydrolase [Melittangium boletus]|uniref:Beta-phosphoglucomutase n=1 Tax=Melittangium boletus DSM 14713 TaxID=1294270 RepID=A0A250IC58_9BACT|nr:HAD family phosphatase [Melittangium boletus]ATB28536.1 haloacid dehalogenase [Melittangium boletus DSM 14713]